MNKYTQMNAIRALAIAQSIMVQRDGKWDRGMLCIEHIGVKYALEQALKLLTEDMLSRVGDN